jgi:hypothetical protein
LQPSAIRKPGLRTNLTSLTFSSGNRSRRCTTGGREQNKKLLRTLQVGAKSVVVTGDDVAKAKPFHDVFIAAANRLAVPIDHCIVVGGSVWDMLAAGRRRALSVGLLSRGIQPSGIGTIRRIPGLFERGCNLCCPFTAVPLCECTYRSHLASSAAPNELPSEALALVLSISVTWFKTYVEQKRLDRVPNLRFSHLAQWPSRASTKAPRTS